MSGGTSAAYELLEAFAGFRGTGPVTSAELPLRLAVVTEDYDGGLVQVRFEGETTPGLKRYTTLQSYNPQPGDRVILGPIGQTWIILGQVDSTPARFADWQSITPAMYRNGWEDFETIEFQAQPEYIRSNDGWVKLKGLVSGGSYEGGASIVLVLPEGYRPTGQLHFATYCNTTLGTGGVLIENDKPVLIRVNPEGEVTIGAGGGNAWLSLDAISFVAES